MEPLKIAFWLISQWKDENKTVESQNYDKLFNNKI